MSALTSLAKAILTLDVKLHAARSKVYQYIAVHQHNKAAAVLASAAKTAELQITLASRRRRLQEAAAFETYSNLVREAAVAQQEAVAVAEATQSKATDTADKHGTLGALVEAASLQHSADAARKAEVVGAL